MNITKAMNVVVAAALEAGKIISANFYQPGGPQGYDGHCDADGEAEAIIRDHLQRHFPQCAIVGEELQTLDHINGSEYLFLCDPNDGTSAFLQGFRGSSLSIGLLHNGIPVLGVVYAPTARSGYGDLFAWCEGGPFTRNGSVVQEVVSPTGVVGVSQAADIASETNQLLCGSYRFLSITSIAYRLALTAAGDLDAGLSLASPVSWDLAAGAALLRSRCGVVAGRSFGQKAPQEIRYDRGNGKIQPIWACLGGDVSAVNDLISQPWENIYQEDEEEVPEWPLCWPHPKEIVADIRLLDCGVGLMLGLLAGDALGSQVEFKHPDEVAAVGSLENMEDGGVWGLMAGQPTDDGELALMLARSLLREKAYSPEAALDAYLYWYQSRPFDIGYTTKTALSAAARKSGSERANAARLAAQTTDSQTNGALMRIAPLALWGYRKDLDEIASAARVDAELTHAHPICVDANRVFVVTLSLLLRGLQPVDACDATMQWAKSAHIALEVMAVLEHAKHALPDDVYKHQGWVLASLGIAYHQLLHAQDLADGIREVVRLGGDTDTNAAITGALLGARFGGNAIPTQWRNMILSARPIDDLAKTIRPRPQAFWPVDAPFLAERLLFEGALQK